MALRDFLFGFKFTATDYVSPVLKKIETGIEGINQQVKNTARWREAGTNIAIMGGAFIAAGGAVGLGLKATIDAAAQMQTEMTHVRTAMADGAATTLHLVQAQSMAEKMSVASGLSAKQEAAAYYIARSNMLDHAQAMAAVGVATKLTVGTTESLAQAQQQLEPTTRLLTSVFQNFGSKVGDPNKQISAFADTLAKLQTQYAFRDIGEVNDALSYATPLAKAAGVSFVDMNAALAVLSVSQKHGAEAGTAFAEVVQKLTSESKLRAMVVRTAAGGLDLGRTLDLLRTKTAGLDDIQRATYLHQIGFTERSIVGVSLMMDKMALYRSAVNDLNNAQGANAAAFAIRQASMEVATGRLAASWDVLKSKIGESLLEPVTSFATELAKAVQWTTALVSAHPQVTKFVVLFAAIGAAVAIAAGTILALAGGIAVAASFLPAFAGFVGTATEIGVAIAAVVAAMAVWHTKIIEVLTAWPSAAFWKQLGWNILKGIGDGILSGATYLLGPLGSVAKLIIDHFPHSPARLGPLRALNRLRIIETIADTMKPSAALTAMRRTAAAIAIAAPMVAAPMIASPALAGARGAAGGIIVQVHQEIHIDGAIAGDDKRLLAVLRHHSEELAAIIDARLVHRSRREF